MPAYAALVFLLHQRQRTLSKMNAFDLVITVAFGSTLATILLDRCRVGRRRRCLALIALQFIVAWRIPLGLRGSHRQGRAGHGLPPRPILTSTMRRERVTRSEILAAIRGENNAQPPRSNRWCWKPPVTFGDTQGRPRIRRRCARRRPSLLQLLNNAGVRRTHRRPAVHAESTGGHRARLIAMARNRRWRRKPMLPWI